MLMDRREMVKNLNLRIKIKLDIRGTVETKFSKGCEIMCFFPERFIIIWKERLSKGRDGLALLVKDTKNSKNKW